MGLVVGIVALILVAATGVMLASLLALRSLAEFAVAVYVLAYAEIVGLVLLLSVLGEPSRAGLVVGSLAALASVSGTLLLLGSDPRAGIPSARLGSTGWSRPVVALLATVLLGVSYVLALVVGTAPNGWDQLNYHLARAAFWLQDGVGYVDAAYDERLNIYPPNGEIPFTFVLGLTGGETYAALAQLAAAAASSLGVFALARRFGLSAAEASFGALLFLALPIVLLQSATTKNDLMVASLLVAAAVLVLADSRRALAVGGLAAGLAMGSKFTAGYGFVVLVALVFVARPRELRGWRLGALLAGAVGGSYWYAVNAYEGGGLLGDRPSLPGLTAFLQPPENLLALIGLTVDWLDLSGANGRDILLYVIAAIVVGAGLAVRSEPLGGSRWRAPVVAAAIVASPLVVWLLTTEVGRPTLEAAYDALGSPQAYLGEGTPSASPTAASDTGSWFGPVGLLLTVGIGIAAIVLARRRELERVALVAAAAPLIWLALVATSLTYHPWQGRFFVFPVALSAALWGLVLRRSVLAWSAVALTASTVVLTLVHYEEKPSGIRLLDRRATTSAWSMTRSELQSLHDPVLEPLFRYVNDEVGSSDSIALALGANDFGYPAFGPQLDRRVELVPFGSSAGDMRTDWLLANPQRTAEIDRSCWAVAFEHDSGTIFRRAEACQA